MNIPLVNFNTDMNTGFKVTDVLSGTDRIPPMGFDRELCVSFLYDLPGRKEKFCTASKCDLQLCLPTCYNDYNDFREAVIMSLRCHD